MNPIDIGLGMRLHVIPSDKFTTNTLCVLIRTPLTREGATQSALLPSVLGRGCARYPSRRDVSLAAERMHGAVFESQIIKKGEQQIIQFYLECVNDSPPLLKDGLLFLREIILQPLTDGEGFKPAYVRGEAELLRKQIEGRINNKSEYAKLKCVEFMCEEEPFGIYGDGYAADLPDITPVSLFYHYKKTMATSPVDFIAIGRWDVNMLRDELTALFSVYRDEPFTIGKPAVRPGRGKCRAERIEAGAMQGNLCVGLRGEIAQTGDEYVRFQLMNEIFGGGANTKLFTQVREQESLCYSIFSFVYRFKSLLCVQCGADTGRFGHIMELIEKALDELKHGDITDDEMENAKRSLCKRWHTLADNPSGCIDFYASQYLLGDEDKIDDLLARVASVKKDDIVEAAGRLTIDTVVTVE